MGTKQNIYGGVQMRKKLISIISIILVISLAFVGCASKEETTQGVTDTTVKVGNSIATSGPLAPVGVPFKAGIEAYFKMTNDEGGVHGRTIEYVHHDDEFNPEKGKAAVDKLINDEKIFAFVGHFGTPIVGATITDIKEAGIPTVYFATGTGLLYKEKAEGADRVGFPVQPVYPMEGRILSAWSVGEFDAKTIGVVYTNDDAGKDLLKGIQTQADIDGLTVVAEQVPPNAEDCAAAITKIKNSDVDVVVVAAIQGTFPQIIKELAKQGVYKPTLTTYVNADQRMTALVAEDVNGQFDIYANAWVDMTKPAIEDFRTWISEVSNEDLTNNAYAMTGWIAAHFFVEGLKRVDGELTWETYMDAMESAPIENPFGGSIDFSDGKRLGTQEMALLKMNAVEAAGWEGFIGFKGIDDILGN